MIGIGIDTAGEIGDSDPHPARVAVKENNKQEVEGDPENHLEGQRRVKKCLADEKAADRKQFSETQVNERAADGFALFAFKTGSADRAGITDHKQAGEHLAALAVGTAQEHADQEFTQDVGRFHRSNLTARNLNSSGDALILADPYHNLRLRSGCCQALSGVDGLCRGLRSG